MFLQGRPREAAFLQTLLQPDPNARPSVDALLKSNLLQSLHASLAGRRPVEAQPAAASAAAAAALQPPQPASVAAAAPSAPRCAAEQPQQQQPAHGEHSLDLQQRLRGKGHALSHVKALAARRPQQPPAAAVLPPSAQALAEAEDKEVLISNLNHCIVNMPDVLAFQHTAEYRS